MLQGHFLGADGHRGGDLSCLAGVCGGVSPHLQCDKPSHEGRVLVLGQQWGWTCCPDRGMLLLLVVKAVMMVVSRW